MFGLEPLGLRSCSSGSEFKSRSISHAGLPSRSASGSSIILDAFRNLGSISSEALSGAFGTGGGEALAFSFPFVWVLVITGPLKNGALKASRIRFAFTGPTPGHRLSSSKVALDIPAKL